METEDKEEICKKHKNWKDKTGTNTRIMMGTKIGLEGTNENGTKSRAGKRKAGTKYKGGDGNRAGERSKPMRTAR